MSLLVVTLVLDFLGKHATKIFSVLYYDPSSDQITYEPHFSSALKCYKRGFTVTALVKSLSSDGAKHLESLNEPSRLHLIEFDLRDESSIENSFLKTKKLIQEQSLTFHALINNAGMMIFGELEWLSPEMIRSQLEVNLLGPMLMMSYFGQLIRQHKTRLINVTSHCSLKPLPGLSVYSASKAGLRFWTEAMVKEMLKFGVDVISFIPGSFVMSSNIAGGTKYWAQQMKERMDEEQHQVYDDYFNRYFSHLSFVPEKIPPTEVRFDQKLLNTMMNAITDVKPKLVYKVEPMRYKIYYFLFKILPQGRFERFVMKKFLMMPQYDE